MAAVFLKVERGFETVFAEEYEGFLDGVESDFGGDSGCDFAGEGGNFAGGDLELGAEVPEDGGGGDDDVPGQESMRCCRTCSFLVRRYSDAWPKR